MHFIQVLLSLLFLFLLNLSTYSQQAEVVRIGELRYVNLSNELPENLASTRSAVIVSVSPDSGRYETRAQWKELTSILHQNLAKVGIDAIVYVHQDDLNAGPEVTEAYRTIFQQRNIANLIYIHHEKTGYRSLYSLMITPFHVDGFMENGQDAWYQSSPDFDRLILRLGRQILRQEMEMGNFLILEHPEYLDDLVVFQGTRYENYPSRLRSLPLAVVAFQKASTENLSDPEVIRKIEAHNAQMDQYNLELREIMKTYPYKYEIVEETSEEKLYDRGFQYALMPMSSSARSIKKILNYPTSPSETVSISSVLTKDSLKALKRMPIDVNVTKYYIKQTIVKDLHTGDEWDADVTWQRALTNFIHHLQVAFN